MLAGVLAWMGIAGCQTQHIDELARARQEAARLAQEGTTARKAGDFERARAKLMEATDLDPSNGVARHALGLVYYESGDLYNAAVQLDAASRLLRDRVQPCYNLGIVLETGRKYEQAIVAYERALHREPEHLHTLENLARVRIKTGRYDRETLRLLTLSLNQEVRPEWTEWLTWETARLRNRLGYHDTTRSYSAKNPSENRDQRGKEVLQATE